MLRPLVLAALALALLAGCGGSEAPASDGDAPPRHTLVFVDRSASTGLQPQSTGVFADTLRQTVRRLLRQPGDRLSAFLVYEKTLSKAQRLDLVNDVAPRAEKGFEDEQALEDARFKRATQTFLDDAETQLFAFLQREPAEQSFTQWTDLWGTLGVASEEFYVEPAVRRLLYLSDMYESMPGPARRDFDRRPPDDRAQAEAWAADDATKLPDLMVLHPARLASARVRVVLGPLGTKPHAQDVKFYWRALFAALGIPPEQVRYN
jgi:hypothetical protein